MWISSDHLMRNVCVHMDIYITFDFRLWFLSKSEHSLRHSLPLNYVVGQFDLHRLLSWCFFLKFCEVFSFRVMNIHAKFRHSDVSWNVHTIIMFVGQFDLRISWLKSAAQKYFVMSVSQLPSKHIYIYAIGGTLSGWIILNSFTN